MLSSVFLLGAFRAAPQLLQIQMGEGYLNTGVLTVRPWGRQPNGDPPRRQIDPPRPHIRWLCGPGNQAPPLPELRISQLVGDQD